jgi:hypothetical protein
MLPVVKASSACAKVMGLHMPLQAESNDHVDEGWSSISMRAPFAVTTAVSPTCNKSMHLPPAHTRD